MAWSVCPLIASVRASPARHQRNAAGSRSPRLTDAPSRNASRCLGELAPLDQHQAAQEQERRVPLLVPGAQAGQAAGQRVRFGLGEAAARGVAHHGADQLRLRQLVHAGWPAAVALHARVGDRDGLLAAAKERQWRWRRRRLPGLTITSSPVASSGSAAASVPSGSGSKALIVARRPSSCQPGGVVGDDRQGLVQDRDGGVRVAQQVVQVVRPGVGDPGQLAVGPAQRDHVPEHGLGLAASEASRVLPTPATPASTNAAGFGPFSLARISPISTSRDMSGISLVSLFLTAGSFASWADFPP